MKTTTLYIIILLGIIGLTSSCEKEVETYHWADCVHFEVKQDGALCDTSRYSFAYEETEMTDMPVTIHIQLTGEIKSYDRKIDLEILNANPEYENYFSLNPDTCYIRKGENALDLTVILHRRPDMTEKEQTLNLIINENEFFKTTNKAWITDVVNNRSVNLLQHTIVSSDILTRPITWYENDNYFGKWSTKKFLLICEETGFKRQDFQDETYMGSGRKNYIKDFMNRYFQEYKATHINDPEALKRIQEEDGTYMQMGS